MIKMLFMSKMYALHVAFLLEKNIMWLAFNVTDKSYKQTYWCCKKQFLKL